MEFILEKADSIREWLQGKKTWIVVIAALLYAVGGWLTDSLSSKEAIEVVLGALGLGGLRSAVKNIE
jgi:hypothetical protein